MDARLLLTALDRLNRDRLLLYPTETFYAIGGNALKASVAAEIYRVKERARMNPLPIILGALEQLEMVADQVPEAAKKLIRRFWPGPLTLLLPALSNLPLPLHGGSGKIAVRLSAHPAARELCLKAGFPLISTSANLSGEAPARVPEEMPPALLEAAGGFIYQAAPRPAGGLPSTIVEIAEGKPGKLRLIRPGAVPLEDLLHEGFTLVDRL
ncbi:MAG: L-threonylcarbamoyladenylate synthase [Desulfovibrionaceae bacterium]|nr:L-threonylcarbamoyladenylate synthase [Desulfovibrionaceae bacterium]